MSRSGRPATAAGPQTRARPESPAGDKPPQQVVNFAFYKLDSAYLRLSADEQRAGAEQFLSVLRDRPEGMIVLCYSTVGMRADCDLMLWRIAESPEQVQAFEAALRGTGLGRYLDPAYSFLSLTKRSTYIDKIDPAHGESRARVVPGRFKYLFVYPFVKTREWYRLAPQTRQGVMDEHIEVGNRYPSVKLNTTYSFGLDDQEFMLGFETDQPGDFLDLVMELRHTDGSKYTLRDTPIFTCLRVEPAQMVRAMGIEPG